MNPYEGLRILKGAYADRGLAAFSEFGENSEILQAAREALQTRVEPEEDEQELWREIQFLDGP